MSKAYTQPSTKYSKSSLHKKKKPARKTNKYNKLFIDNIPPFITTKELEEYFSNYAEVKRMSIPKDKRGGNQNYAIAYFRKKAEMLEIPKKNHNLYGYQLDCQIMKKDDEDDWEIILNNVPKRKVFIPKFKFDLENNSKELLKDYFEENYGAVSSISVNFDPKLGKFEEFCLVYFKEVASVQNILKKKRHRFNKFEFKVEKFEGSNSNKYRRFKKGVSSRLFRLTVGFPWEKKNSKKTKIERVLEGKFNHKEENLRVNFRRSYMNWRFDIASLELFTQEVNTSQKEEENVLKAKNIQNAILKEYEFSLF